MPPDAARLETLTSPETRPAPKLVRVDVYERLRSEILACTLRPGTQLQEKDLAEKYGVSKSPIRDALLRLQEQHLIEVLPRKGYRVTPIKMNEIGEMYEMRSILECSCVRRLIDEADDAAREVLLENASLELLLLHLARRCQQPARVLATCVRQAVLVGGIDIRDAMLDGSPVPASADRNLLATSRAASVEALAAGAVNIITKPRLDLKNFLKSSAAELVAAALLGTLFVRRQLRMKDPMMPVEVFGRPIFALSISAATCTFTAQGLAFVSLPFFFHTVLGRSATDTGILLTAWPLALAGVAPIAGRLADRHHAGFLGAIGLSSMTAGLVLTALLPPNPSTANIMWRLVLCGAGFGIFASPNNRLMMNAVPRERSGSAASSSSAGRRCRPRSASSSSRSTSASSASPS